MWQSSTWRFDTFGYCLFQSLQTNSVNALLYVAGAGFGFPSCAAFTALCHKQCPVHTSLKLLLSLT